MLHALSTTEKRLACGSQMVMAEEGCHANTATGDGFELRMESGNSPLRAVWSEPSHRPPWLTGGRAGGGTWGSPVFSVPWGETRVHVGREWAEAWRARTAV